VGNSAQEGSKLDMPFDPDVARESVRVRALFEEQEQPIGSYDSDHGRASTGALANSCDGQKQANLPGFPA
jgi:hypothetical protein